MLGKCLRLFAALGAVALVLSCGGRKAPSLSSDWTTGVPARHSGEPAPSSPTTNIYPPWRDEHLPVVVGPTTGVAGVPTAIPLVEALTDLDALPTPAGVDESLFSKLKVALREALLETVGASRLGVTVPPPTLSPSPLPLTPAKLASRPPTGPSNRVDDLEITDLHDGTYTLTWSYRNCGDYNQDGIVNIMDITPLAVHFGEYADNTNRWIDGNGNGYISILDVTPVAANFFCEVAGYSVQGQVALGSWREIDSVSLSLAHAEAGRLHLACG